MRKIEQQMLTAIHHGKSWTSGNTMVDVHNGRTRVYLHGNLIAESDINVNAGRWMFTLAGWATPTTRSRLNAIAKQYVSASAGFYQKANTQYFAQPGVGPQEISAHARIIAGV